MNAMLIYSFSQLNFLTKAFHQLVTSPLSLLRLHRMKTALNNRCKYSSPRLCTDIHKLWSHVVQKHLTYCNPCKLLQHVTDMRRGGGGRLCQTWMLIFRLDMFTTTNYPSFLLYNTSFCDLTHYKVPILNMFSHLYFFTLDSILAKIHC